jgi:hypothetical protein
VRILLEAELDGRTPKPIADALDSEIDGLDEKWFWDQLQAARKLLRPEEYRPAPAGGGPVPEPCYGGEAHRHCSVLDFGQKLPPWQRWCRSMQNELTPLPTQTDSLHGPQVDEVEESPARLTGCCSGKGAAGEEAVSGQRPGVAKLSVPEPSAAIARLEIPAAASVATTIFHHFIEWLLSLQA